MTNDVRDTMCNVCGNGHPSNAACGVIDPVMVAILRAPLAPPDERITVEERAEMDRAVSDIKAGRVKAFTTGEVAASLLRTWGEGGRFATDFGDESAIQYFKQVMADECSERGITETTMLAEIDEKHAFNARAEGTSRGSR